jgi:crotonobetainyl-CoA:carnitine CoA-transferase CaiB-like acyl-CoA transferase
VAALLPHVDGNPQPRFLPMTLADKVSGLHAAYAVLAAIVHRLRTGEGQCVEVPMYESVASFHLLEHLCNATFVPATGPALYPRQVDPARQPMRTKDGWIAIAPYLDDRWVRLFDAIGLGHLLKEPRFADVRARRRHMGQMHDLVAELTPTRSTAEWLALLKQINVPASRVNEIEDLLSDEQLRASGLLQQRTHPTEGDYLEVAAPVRFSAWQPPEPRPAARVGEHSEALAQELRAQAPSARS